MVLISIILASFSVTGIVYGNPGNKHHNKANFPILTSPGYLQRKCYCNRSE